MTPIANLDQAPRTLLQPETLCYQSRLFACDSEWMLTSEPIRAFVQAVVLEDGSMAAASTRTVTGPDMVRTWILVTGSMACVSTVGDAERT